VIGIEFRTVPLRLATVLAATVTMLALATSTASARTSSSVDRLSLAQLGGQRAIFSYSGTTPPRQLYEKIRAGQVGGVILFGPNITSREQIAGVVASFQRARLQSSLPGPIRRLPLLIMTDQEGGIVKRLPGPPELSERQIGKTGSSSLARSEGAAAAQNLLDVGITVNLAPVLDVSRPGGGFLTKFDRIYSPKPHVVARLGAASISGQQSVGVAATAKHFPGLGAAVTDTDSGPVTLTLSKATLHRVDEVPYPFAIRAGTRLVMLNHAIYPALDPGRPASLSKRVVDGELRRRLGFEGVTITDALEAGALEAFGNIGERGVKAALAGEDLLLYSAKSVNEGVKGVAALRAALQSGRLDVDAFKRSLERVLRLRADLHAGGPLGPP
jgi:beta-N-acetylhexosaminidase